MNALRRSPHRGVCIWDDSAERVNNITLLTEIRLLLNKSSVVFADLFVFVIGTLCLIVLHGVV